MDVSIIMPSYNNAELLVKTLAGLAAQKDLDLKWEVIVIDNNTSDASMAEAQLRFRNKLPVTLIMQPELPHTFALCKARNIGLRLAKGTWIVCLDADVIPNKDYLKRLAAYIKEWGNRAVIAACERVFIATDMIDANDILEDPGVLARAPHTASPSNYGLPQDRRLPHIKGLPNINQPWDYMHGCNVIFRRDVALGINGYDESYDGRWGFEDIDFAYRMIAHAGCEPLYASGLYVYHQDLPNEKEATDRNAKNTNPNWARICELIPGYKEYKTEKYRRLSERIKV